MSQNKIGANGPATLGHEPPSTAFESNIERTSAGAYTKGNTSTRPTSAYPIVSGFRRSQEKSNKDIEFMSQ